MAIEFAPGEAKPLNVQPTPIDVKGLLSNKDYLYEGRSGSYVSQITFRTK